MKEAVRQVGVDREFAWNWVVVQGRQEDKERLRARQNTIGEICVEASGQGSSLVERKSFFGVPQAESSRIVQDMEIGDDLGDRSPGGQSGRRRTQRLHSFGCSQNTIG